MAAAAPAGLATAASGRMAAAAAAGLAAPSSGRLAAQPQPGWPPQPYYYPGYPQPAGPMPGFVWAGMMVRLGALLIDAGVVFVAMLIALAAAEAFGVDRTGTVAEYSAGADLMMFLWVGLLLVYHPVFWWSFQGTPGQRVLGLRVVRAVDGSPLGVGATLGRYAVWLGCQISFILTIVAAALASEEPGKRTWWDKASGSAVVRSV